MPPKIDEKNFNDFFDNKIFKDISSDIAKLTSDIRQPDKFAQIFCEAAKTQKSIDNTLKDVLVDLLQKDVTTHIAITSIIEKVDRNYMRILSGKIGLAIWAIVVLIIEKLLTKFV